MSRPARNLPPAVARGKAIADIVRGHEVLLKCRSYMGPVHVDEAMCTYRWFRLALTTRPWQPSGRAQTIRWQIAPPYVVMAHDRIVLRAHDVVGMVVHDPARMAAIEALWLAGAGTQALLNAFNHIHLIPDGTPSHKLTNRDAA